MSILSSTNVTLQRARRNRDDEFYTSYETIQKEVPEYKNDFFNKVVICNCDDPYESNFAKFFIRNFNDFGLKRLLCISYGHSPIASEKNESHGKLLDISNVAKKDHELTDEEIKQVIAENKIKVLKGDGDFRSEESIEYLIKADIVVTNPPFSLFRDYVPLLMRYDKKFLIIGNMNAITYKEVFPLIKENKLWIGPSITSGDRKFNVPNSYPLNAANCGTDADGKKFIRVKGVRWFTNLDHRKRHEELILVRKYSEDEYPKYDNYNAINVNKVCDIPCDYNGVMGVPITFLDKYNPEQFQIIKFRKGDDNKDLSINGYCPYFRILIKSL